MASRGAGEDFLFPRGSFSSHGAGTSGPWTLVRGQQGSGQTGFSPPSGQEPVTSKEGSSQPKATSSGAHWALPPNSQCRRTQWSLSNLRIRSLAPKGPETMRPPSHLYQRPLGLHRGSCPRAWAGPGARPGHLPPHPRAGAARWGPPPGWATGCLQPILESS